MKFGMKKLVSFGLVAAMSLAISVPAFATQNDNIAYDVGITRSSGKINFHGGVKKSYATEAFAQVKGYDRGIEICESGTMGTSNAYAEDSVKDEGGGMYELEFYGYVNYGPNSAYQDDCHIKRHLTVPNRVLENGIESQVTNLAATIVTDAGYNLGEYSKVDVFTDKLPKSVIDYYFLDLETGVGSSKPVVYKNVNHNQYIIAFQNSAGINITKEINFSPENNTINVISKDQQSVKVYFK